MSGDEQAKITIGCLWCGEPHTIVLSEPITLLSIMADVQSQVSFPIALDDGQVNIWPFCRRPDDSWFEKVNPIVIALEGSDE